MQCGTSLKIARGARRDREVQSRRRITTIPLAVQSEVELIPEFDLLFHVVALWLYGSWLFPFSSLPFPLFCWANITPPNLIILSATISAYYPRVLQTPVKLPLSSISDPWNESSRELISSHFPQNALDLVPFSSTLSFLHFYILLFHGLLSLPVLSSTISLAAPSLTPKWHLKNPNNIPCRLGHQSLGGVGQNHDEKPPKSPISDLTIAKAVVPDEATFPEGGARAWSVAVGAAGVMFATLGYSNAYG